MTVKKKDTRKKPLWIEITWCTTCHSKVWNGVHCKCLEREE